MRRIMIAGNAKMNLNRGDLSALLESLAEAKPQYPHVDVVYCPPFTLLTEASRVLKGSAIGLGGQDCHWAGQGAYTGEISVPMLVEAGCAYVIVGHSERRQYFGETNDSVAQKSAAAMAVGLIPIVCVGESLEEREQGRTEAVLKDQLKGSLNGLNPDRGDALVLAYEPVWAIGTGKTATPEQAQETQRTLRQVIAAMWSEPLSQEIRILYGGSVKGDNARELLGCPDVDGALVGGASLTPEAFLPILKGASN